MATDLDHILAGIAFWGFVEANDGLVYNSVAVLYFTKVYGVGRLRIEVFACTDTCCDSNSICAAEADDAYGSLAGRVAMATIVSLRSSILRGKSSDKYSAECEWSCARWFG